MGHEWKQPRLDAALTFYEVIVNDFTPFLITNNIQLTVIVVMV